jgi:lipoprotein-releasing system ATP-binding protein
MPDAAPLLHAENLGKTYGSGPGAIQVFRGLELALYPGDRVALTGESGTGKSTLLHLLGLLDPPTEGRIWIAGQDTSRLTEPQLAVLRNRTLGFVWQFSTLLPEFTAAENTGMPMLIRGANPKDARDRAMQLLEGVGLAARAHHLAGELSGGEQQRVVLARALAGSPRILLADEPTGNLDERTGAAIMDLIEKIHEDYSLTTLYVTHNPAFAARARQVLQLRQGQIQGKGLKYV